MRANVQTATLYDVIKPSSRLMEVPLLLGFNLVLVACASLSFNLPFSPVPVTAQTFGVLLVAMVLGRVRGTAVVLAYLAEGALGLPVFAGGKAGIAALVGPTGGYLVGFLAAAYLVGSLSDRGWDRGFGRSVAAMTLGTILIFLCGLTQLALYTPDSAILAMGLYPFIPGALIKIGVAAVILPSIWRFLKRD